MRSVDTCIVTVHVRDMCQIRIGQRFVMVQDDTILAQRTEFLEEAGSHVGHNHTFEIGVPHDLHLFLAECGEDGEIIIDPFPSEGGCNDGCGTYPVRIVMGEEMHLIVTFGDLRGLIEPIPQRIDHVPPIVQFLYRVEGIWNVSGSSIFRVVTSRSISI